MDEGIIVEYKDDKYGQAVAITLDSEDLSDGRVRLLTMWDSLELRKPDDLQSVEIPEEAQNHFIKAKESQDFLFLHGSDIADGSIPGWTRESWFENADNIYIHLNEANKILRRVTEDIPMDPFKIFNYTCELDNKFKELGFHTGGRVFKDKELRDYYSLYWFASTSLDKVPRGLKMNDNICDAKDVRVQKLIEENSLRLPNCRLSCQEWISKIKSNVYVLNCTYLLVIENPTLERTREAVKKAFID